MIKALYSFSILILCISTAVAQSCGYSFQKEITIDKANVSGNAPLLNFPMLISVTDNDLRHTTSSGNVENINGYDIIFTSEDGEIIPHQIEDYTSTNGNLIAWVKIPVLYASKNTRINMLYGNSLITSDQSSLKVWDDNYQAVWHLHDDINDGTDLGNNGTDNGSTDASAKIADGQSFDGNNDYISITDASLNGNIPSISSGSPDEFTLSGWIYLDAINARSPLLSKQGIGPGNDRGFVFMMEDDNRLKTELFKNNVSGDRTEVYSTATLGTNTWYYISMTYQYVTDGTSEVRLYINGVNDGSTSTSIGPILDNSQDLDIGRYYWNGSTQYYLDGLIDEVRISDVVRDAGWIATEYSNQNDPSSFYSIGPETGGSFTPTIPVCGFGYRKTITTDNTEIAGGTDHIDFPVLISLTDNDLRTVANGGHVQSANGYDIVFVDDNLDHLDHQIETYDATTGEFVAWVRIPALPTGSDFNIHMFYGNDGVYTDPSSSCTWLGNFDAVYHLHDDFLDASGNEYNGTNNGSTDNTSSIIGDGQAFDGTQFIELTNFPNKNTDFTITGWIRTTDNTQGGQRILCDDELNSGGYALSLGDGGAGRLRFYSRGMSNVIVDGPNNVSNNIWYYVAGVVDRTNEDRIIYLNGTAIASDLTDVGTWGVDNGDASIGGETASGETANRFEGFLDEIRVASTVRSAAWLTTEYNNQSNPANFYTVSNEFVLNATSVQNGDWDQTSTWSSGEVPGFGANVTIEHDVDLDDRDETICNLTVTSLNNNTTTFEIQNARHLTVGENVYLDGSDNTDSEDVTIRLTNNSSQLTVNREFIINQSAGDDIFIDLESADDSLVIRGNLILTHSGGDEMDIILDDADAVIRVYGDVLASMNGGADDILLFDLNNGLFLIEGTLQASRFNDFSDIYFDLDGGSLTADSVYISSSGGGGDDQVFIYVDENSQFVVNGSMLIDMNGGDDLEIEVNGNAGTSGLFEINGDLIINKSGGDDLNILVDDDNSMFHVTDDFYYTSTGAEQVTIEIDNTGTFDVDGNIYWNHDAGQTDEIYLQGGGGDNPLFNVDGDFIVNHTGGNDDFILDLDGGTLSVQNDFLITKNDNTGNVIDFDMDDGTLTVGDTLYLLHQGDNNVTLDLDGNSTINAGYMVCELSGVSAGEEFLIDIDGTSIFNVTNDLLLILNSGNDLEFHLGENSGGSTAQLNVGGNMTLDHNGGSGGDDIQFFISDNSHVTITGLFTMDTDGSTGTGNFITELNNDAILTVGSDIVMNNTIAAGYLEIEMNDQSLLQIGGNFVRPANPNNFGLVQSNSNSVTIEYNGTMPQVFADEDGAGSDGIEYENVIINNSFGTEPQLTMEAPVTLTNSITFFDGVLHSTSVNLLSIGDDAVATEGNAGSYVSGPMSKIGDDEFVFALGKDGNWARLAISNLQNGPNVTDEFTAEYFLETHPESFLDSNEYAGNPGGMYNTSIVEYWDLDQTNGNTEPQVSLYWNDNNASFITDTAELVVGHYLGGNVWANEEGASSGSLASGYVRSLNNISSFSVFTFGSVSSSANPLPIELLSFEAKSNGDIVDLNWSTLSETNNDYFTVERSEDARNFTPILDEKGAGNSRTQIDYLAIDPSPLSGTSYYRLKQTDFDGKSSFSKIEVITRTNNTSNEISFFPNPADKSSPITMMLDRKIKGDIQVIVNDMTGREIVKNNQTLQHKSNSILLEGISDLSAGTYLVQVMIGDHLKSALLIIK